MTEHELSILEELLNEAIKEYFDSGYSIKDEYIKTLRCILKRFNLKVKFYNNIGVSRVVLARECSKENIKEIEKYKVGLKQILDELNIKSTVFKLEL